MMSPGMNNGITTLKRVAAVVAAAGSLVAVTFAPLGAGSEDAGAAVAPDARRSPGPALKPRNDIPGLPNFAKVSDALYRGGQPDERGFRRLKEMGVKTIVNLRSAHSDEDELEGLGLDYVRIKMDYLKPRDDEIAAFLKLVTDAKHQPVFVHCQYGSDRTGTMVAAYRMAVEGWDNRRTIDELPIFGFHGIWRPLKSYLEDFDPDRVKERAKTVRMPRIITPE